MREKQRTEKYALTYIIWLAYIETPVFKLKSRIFRKNNIIYILCKMLVSSRIWNSVELRSVFPRILRKEIEARGCFNLEALSCCQHWCWATFFSQCRVQKQPDWQKWISKRDVLVVVIATATPVQYTYMLGSSFSQALPKNDKKSHENCIFRQKSHIFFRSQI